MDDLTGMRFGRYTVLEFDHYYESKNSGKRPMWKCKCDCGNIRIVRGSTLLNGQAKSCGCLRDELVGERASKHHGFGTRLYAVWDTMRQRCNNPNQESYSRYGGRGIKVCPEWDDFNVFREWAYANGYNDKAEKSKCTLDRIDVDNNYSPENCRWCDMKVQSNNKSNTVYLEHNGVTKTLSEWADELGLKYCTVWKRYSKGWNSDKILSPV